MGKISGNRYTRKGIYKRISCQKDRKTDIFNKREEVLKIQMSQTPDL